MTIDDFWNAVADNDTDSVSDLLNESPSLVNERFHGIAWHPDERKKPSQFPFTNTALHCAAVNSQVKLATLLLSKGADPNADPPDQCVVAGDVIQASAQPNTDE